MTFQSYLTGIEINTAIGFIFRRTLFQSYLTGIEILFKLGTLNNVHVPIVPYWN